MPCGVRQVAPLLGWHCHAWDATGNPACATSVGAGGEGSVVGV